MEQRRRLGTAMFIVLLSVGARATAQPSVNTSNQRSEPEATAALEARDDQGHAPRVRLLENQAQQQWIVGADELAREKRRAEFYKTAYWFIVANPKYAESKQNERLLEEVFAVTEADRKTRRVRTLEDVFELAAQRLHARDAEEANKRDWLAEVERFLDEHAPYRRDRVLLEHFDKTVRALGENAQNQHKNARWFLDEAHSIIRARFPDRFAEGGF